MEKRGYIYPAYPTPQTLEETQKIRGNKKWVWMLLTVIVFLLVVAGGLYYFLGEYEIKKAEKTIQIANLIELKCMSLCPHEQNLLYNSTAITTDEQFREYANPGCVDYCSEQRNEELKKIPRRIRNDFNPRWVNNSLGWNLNKYVGICSLVIYYHNKQRATLKGSFGYPDLQVTRRYCNSLMGDNNLINLSDYRLGDYKKYDLKLINYSCTIDKIKATLKWDTSSLQMNNLKISYSLHKKNGELSRGGELTYNPLHIGEIREISINPQVQAQNDLDGFKISIKWDIAVNKTRYKDFSCKV
jgi:hypothetical protein